MTPGIVPIVEGIGEVASVPILLRGLLSDLATYHVRVLEPYRVGRKSIVKEGQLERTIEQVLRSRPGVGAILLILDADDDCPAKLGPELLNRCIHATSLPTAVILANREFETWFLGAKESLRGNCGLLVDATAPSNPESIRGAKEHLTQNMARNRRYNAVKDQPTLTARMDRKEARKRCPSFDKLVREVEGLLSEMQP